MQKPTVQRQTLANVLDHSSMDMCGSMLATSAHRMIHAAVTWVTPLASHRHAGDATLHVMSWIGALPSHSSHSCGTTPSSLLLGSLSLLGLAVYGSSHHVKRKARKGLFEPVYGSPFV